MIKIPTLLFIWVLAVIVIGFRAYIIQILRVIGAGLGLIFGYLSIVIALVIFAGSIALVLHNITKRR